ncbi:MAG: ABC transporter permease [Bacteroidota bacterium]
MTPPPRPPKWPLKWLARFCQTELIEGISGDLEELYFENIQEKGKVKANLLYWLQSVGFVRLIFKKKPKKTSNMRAIWTNYLVTAFRSLKRQRTFFAINLVGLIIAITCLLFALVYINDELQFDRHHDEGEHIHRLYKRHINEAEGVDHLTYDVSGMMGVTMKEEFPEVLEMTRVLPWWHPFTISYQEINISTEGVHFVDENFFEMFDFEVVAGDPNTFLDVPSSVVLTEKVVKQLFPNETVPPLGKKITVIGEIEFTITGIVKDPPRQSSFEFSALLPWNTTKPGVGPLSWDWMHGWLAQGIYTFVQLAPGADPDALVEKLPGMMDQHFEERSDQYFLKLQPLYEMHLYGEDIRGTERMKSGSITFIYTLGFSAFFVFLIACVNYINISLSRALRTVTEVGVRKAMGSTRSQLTARFIAETLIYSVLASILSLAIIYFLLPLACELSGKELPFTSFLQPISLLALLSFKLVTSLVAGLYPALMLSAPSVSSILKSGSNQTTNAGGVLKNGLLTLQYAISIFLIICTVTVIKQINYLQDKPLGFDKKQVLVLDIGNEIHDNAEQMQDLLLQHPNILSISKGLSTMGNASYTIKTVPEGYKAELDTRIFHVDPQFFETYGIESIMGRTFLEGSLADSGKLVINQAMTDFMGWEDPIGKRIRVQEDNSSYPIIGVVNDFHVHSLTTSVIDPMIIRLNTWRNWYMSVRIGDGNLQETVMHINNAWDKFATRTPFDFYFVDDWFQNQYSKERNLLGISTIYAIISLILCALGLYGLTALHLQHRSKEISIRKVLGAPVSSIVAITNRQFLLFIMISIVIAIPSAWYFISEWLDQFAYKISVDSTPFIYSVLLIIIVSTLIISLLSIKTASLNPLKNLKAE